MREYDDIFAEFVAGRSQTTGVAEVSEFLKSILPGSSLLDVGCGHGIPLARLFREKGYKVHGIDSSKKMATAFKKNFPEFSVECASILDCDLSGRSFEAAVAWGVLFHLSPEEQELAIKRITRSLLPGGRFLFTAGKEHDQRTGPMYGVTFRYYSLGSIGYRRILQKNNCRLLSEFSDSDQNYYYGAEKVASPAAPPGKHVHQS